MPGEHKVGDEIPGLGTIGGLGPGASHVQPVDPKHHEGPWRWQAAGPRGVKEGVAPSYDEAWTAARSAGVGRLSTDEDPTMPNYEPLWIKYPIAKIQMKDTD